MMLLTVEQPDVKSQGVVFSVVVIYCMNLFTMVVTATALSRSATFGMLARSLGGDFVMAYSWTLDNLIALWHYAATFVSQTHQH
jgi:hypothetical protein